MSKNIIIVDIDGTISKVGDRLKYLQQTPKNWDKFYNACFDDEPIHSVIDLIETLWGTSKAIVFCTGRIESVRSQTIKWINKHIDIDNDDYKLVMRPDDDYRHDTEVKPEQLSNAGIMLQQIAFVLEDRDSMVKKWRELGLTCLQVADGNF